jgi:hypothetical protein
MNSSPEQIQIVGTVLNEFLPVGDNQPATEKILGIVLKYVEGNANQATTRCEVRTTLVEINQQVDDDRLNLCIDTAHALAWSYLHWIQGQESPDELDIYPALQLYDCYHHAEPVDWVQKWRDNGGQVFESNKMIALRNDRVWTRISAFSLPFPPFDLDSGMDLDVVPRNEVEKLGLISPKEQVEPVVVDLNFGPALKARIDFYFGAESRRQRFEQEVERAEVKDLLEMAEDRLDSDEDSEVVREAIFILDEAVERGLDGSWENQAKAYGLLA